MTEVIGVPLESGGALLVEVDAPGGTGVVKAGRPGQVAEQAVQTLESALGSLMPGAAAVLEKLREVKPSEIDLVFGIKLTAEAGAVIAKTAGECNFSITLRWRETAPNDG